jgi:type II secretory pathway pseudopilin PulG
MLDIGVVGLKNEGGFLLLELLVALLVLAIVAGPLVSLLVLGIEMLHGAGEYTVAVNLAREKMEEVKGAGFGGAVCVVEEDAGGFDGVRREVSVWEAACGAGEMELKVVIVRVVWQEAALEREVRLVTFLAGR